LYALPVAAAGSQGWAREVFPDVARAAICMCDGIDAVFIRERYWNCNAAPTVPVINSLSDVEHPLKR